MSGTPPDHISEEALQAISQYGRSDFLHEFAASPEYGFTQMMFGKTLEKSVETAIRHHHKDYLVDLFEEFEKHNLNLGIFPLLVLQKVIGEKSVPLLHSYLLASARFLARFSRPFTLLDEIDLPEGRAVLVDEGLLAGDEPRSLFMTCSAAIRRNLCHPVTETAQRLPLPKIMKQCLLFKFDA